MQHVGGGLALRAPLELPEARLDHPHGLPLLGLLLPPPPGPAPGAPPRLGLERLPDRGQVQPRPRGGGRGGVGAAEAREQLGLRDRRVEERLELPGPRADEAEVLPQAAGEEGQRALPGPRPASPAARGRGGRPGVDAEACHGSPEESEGGGGGWG